MRVAIIGGSDYDETALEDFLYALSRKHPDAVIVTGTAVGKHVYQDVPGQFDRKGQPKRERVRTIPSAEGMAQSLLTGLGHTVETPDMTTKTAQHLGGGSDLQLGWILSGQWELYRDGKGVLQHRFITPRPDVIVVAGNPDSSRAKTAADHWKKMDAWRDRSNQRVFHNVAAPPKKVKAKKYKATKKVERG